MNFDDFIKLFNGGNLIAGIFYALWHLIKYISTENGWGKINSIRYRKQMDMIEAIRTPEISITTKKIIKDELNRHACKKTTGIDANIDTQKKILNLIEKSKGSISLKMILQAKRYINYSKEYAEIEISKSDDRDEKINRAFIGYIFILGLAFVARSPFELSGASNQPIVDFFSSFGAGFVLILTGILLTNNLILPITTAKKMRTIIESTNTASVNSEDNEE